MSDIIRTIYLIKSDPVKNNNKFWKGTEFSSGDILCEWGRVGSTGQSKMFSGAGKSFLDKKAREKMSEGRNDEIAYRMVEVVDGVSSASSPIKNNHDITQIAKQQIQHSDPLAAEVISYLSMVNIHNIGMVSNGRIVFNAQKGACETPMGLIGLTSITEARGLLSGIGDLVLKRNYGESLMDLTRNYLMKIPTDIGHKRLVLEEFWRDVSCVQKQNDLLDALQASLTQATTNTNSSTVPSMPKLFDCKLSVVNDKLIIKKIFDDYYRDRSTMHTCHHLKPKTVWEVSIGAMREEFEKDGKKMPNVVEGYHSSNAANILSILKSGLRIPPRSAPHVCGRLYGDGAYMAPVGVKGSPTKSLGYGYGFWGGTTQKRFFMFIGDWGLGKYYVPSASNYQSISYPVRGFDSVWAKGNQSGVRNDECVVFRTSQANLKYLIEFE